MSDKISVVSLQFLPADKNPQENLRIISTLLEEHAPSKIDLIVFPEFFNTGINLTADDFRKFAAKDNTSLIFDFAAQIAQKYASYVVCGSILEERHEKFYNTSVLFDREGNCMASYDKMHLFNYFGGNEGEYTEPGSETVVVDTDFGKLGLSVCFDIRFAGCFHELMKKGAEIITNPAAWSTLNSATQAFRAKFDDDWKLMAKTRAFDNVCAVITSNQCGRQNSFLTSIGFSQIVNHEGVVLACAGADEKTLISAEIDLKALREARKQFPIVEIG